MAYHIYHWRLCNMKFLRPTSGHPTEFMHQERVDGALWYGYAFAPGDYVAIHDVSGGQLPWYPVYSPPPTPWFNLDDYLPGGGGVE